jgi:hypothetical protein
MPSDISSDGIFDISNTQSFLDLDIFILLE